MPPHLDDTPGPPVVVDDDWYDAGVFRARYPGGWRVITSPADAPPFALFVSPDDCALIMVAVTEMDVPAPGSGCEAGALRTETRALDAGMFVAITAPEAAWTTYEEAFESVVESLDNA